MKSTPNSPMDFPVCDTGTKDGLFTFSYYVDTLKLLWFWLLLFTVITSMNSLSVSQALVHQSSALDAPRLFVKMQVHGP